MQLICELMSSKYLGIHANGNIFAEMLILDFNAN